MDRLKERLLALLRDRSFKKGEVRLASGKTSNFFIDCKQTMLLAEGHMLVGEVICQVINRFKVRPVAVAGVELGGCPLASAVALTSYIKGDPLDAVYVRKQVKDHGSSRTLEGNSQLASGAPLVVLEDVITTGQSTLYAVSRLRESGLDVVGVVVLVDRLEGGREALEAQGLQVISLFTRDDFTTDGM